MVKKVLILLILLLLISGCSQKLPLSDDEFEIAKRAVQCFYVQRLKNKCWIDNKVELLDFYPIESDNPDTNSYAVYMRFSPFNCQDKDPQLEHCSRMYITNPMETCSFIESTHIFCENAQNENWEEPIPLRIE